MPPEAISLALAASIYPPALAAVIALGRGQEVRLRVVLLVAAAYLTVFVTGALMLFLFTEAGATSSSARAPSSGLYIVGGIASLVFARRLARRPPRKAEESSGPSRTDRYLQSRRLILMLGFLLYVVPSPIYIGAVKALADTKSSTATQLSYLALMLLIMLWLIELPMLAVIAFPERATAVLESVNDWFARNGRRIGVIALVVLGLYLLGVGIAGLVAG